MLTAAEKAVVAVTDVMVIVDAGVGLEAAELASAWNADAGAAGWGVARVRPASPAGVFLPGLPGTPGLPEVLEMVVVPMVVNLAVAVLHDLVRRLVSRLRTGGDDAELEIVAVSTAGGDRVLVVRERRERG